MNAGPERVFISYSQDSAQHMEKVRDLADRLRSQGINAIIDQYYQSPALGWPRWMEEQCRSADFVLVVCTETYQRRAEGREEPGRGQGAVVESAFWLQRLVDNYAYDIRMVPILMTQEDRKHIPVPLRGQTYYVFPGDYEKLYRRLTNQPEVLMPPLGQKVKHAPAGPVRRQPAGRKNWTLTLQNRPLQGAGDPLLMPAREAFVGRDQETQALCDYLDGQGVWSSVSFVNVVGTGGIGKTEVCKAALRAWLSKAGSTNAYYVSLAGARTANDLISRLAQATGADQLADRDETLTVVSKRQGVYYLDNLESVQGQSKARQILMGLKASPGVRLLTSSRIRIRGMGKDIPIPKLSDDEAVNLFQTIWTEAGGEPLPDTTELRRFVGAAVPREHGRGSGWTLGCHPLSIVLVASHGYTATLPEIIGRWRSEGVAVAEALGVSSEKEYSLSTSIGLSLGTVAHSVGALVLWGVASFFPDGMGQKAFSTLLRVGCFTYADREQLLTLNVLQLAGDRLELLPPLARYTFDQMRNRKSVFPTKEIVMALLSYFDDLAQHRERRTLFREVSAVHRLILCAVELEPDLLPALSELAVHLADIYKDSIYHARDILQTLCSAYEGLKWYPPETGARNVTSLAELETRMGDMEAARRHFLKAAGLQKAEGDFIGLAQTMEGLGDLAYRLDNPSSARRYYRRAANLYEREEIPQGLANVLLSAGILAQYVGDEAEALRLLDDAVKLFRQLDDKLGLANARSAIASVKFDLGDYEESSRLLHEALALFREEPDAVGQSDAFQKLGDVALAQHDRNEAARFYREARDLAESSGDILCQANAARRMGQLELLHGNWLAAHDTLEQCQKLYQRSRDTEGLALASAYLAEVSAGSGDLIRMQELLKAATQAARACGSPRTKTEVQQIKASLSGGLGQ